MNKLGVPKLINDETNGYESTYSVMVNDTYLTNISEFELDLSVSSNNELKLTIINPEVDLKLGHYHITSHHRDHLAFYNVENINTGEAVSCQGIKFDGKEFVLTKSNLQLDVDAGLVKKY